MTKRERIYHRRMKIAKQVAVLFKKPRRTRRYRKDYYIDMTNGLAAKIDFSTPSTYDCDKMDVFFDEYPKRSEPPPTLQCSKEYMESMRKLPVVNTFGNGDFRVEVRESSVFPYEKKWPACDIETKLEHQIPTGEWIHGVMVAPLPREQSMGPIMTEKPAFHPYLDKLREEMYGYQYRFMTF